MHVRVGGPVVVGNGVEHRLRLLGRRGVVEIDQRVSVLPLREQWEVGAEAGDVEHQASRARDRKSTRLNSSHGYISYAVFCLKKKKETDGSRRWTTHSA